MIPKRIHELAAITGIGVVNSIATGFESFTDALASGRSGVGLIKDINLTGLRSNKICAAQQFDHKSYGASHGERNMDRSSAMVMTAWNEAMVFARLDTGIFDKSRGAVAMGTTLGGSINGFDYYSAREKGKTHRLSLLRDYNLHAPGYRICIDTGFTGPNYVFSSACTSSNLALSMALDLIRYDKSDIVICGGYDTLSLVTCAGFSVMRNVSPSTCRPFDSQRDGLVLGEGAAIMVVERESSARARGVSPLAYIRGSSITSDAYHMTAPDVSASGSIRCIQAALNDADISNDEIDFIAAHGTGTPHNDSVEARSITKVFGDKVARIPIASIKSAIGHTLGAAGAMNAAAAIAARRRGIIPGTLNFRNGDKNSALSISARVRDHKPSMCLSNTLGFGGSNCSIILELV